MKITIVGCGDAFGSGGRAHTCFRVDSDGRTLVVDFGASAVTAWKQFGFNSDAMDGVLVSHLHGDHFGGLPFLLLDCQFASGRKRPLTLAGPKGFRARLERTQEALFPGSTAIHWHFPLEVTEIDCGETVDVAGFKVDTAPVQHPSGAPATAVRLANGRRTFAYSGDCAWTDRLFEFAKGVDLFIVECSSGEEPIANHIDWPTLRAKLPDLSAERTVVTHMSDSALAKAAEMEAEGLTLAHDGLVIEI